MLLETKQQKKSFISIHYNWIPRFKPNLTGLKDYTGRCKNDAFQHNFYASC